MPTSPRSGPKRGNTNKMNPVGLYIDFPFCIARCAFCAFNIQGYRERWAGRYLSALQKELALHVELGTLREREIISLYLGGGTPTLYPPEALSEIISFCRRYFHVRADVEITVEAHPATIRLQGLASPLAGVAPPPPAKPDGASPSRTPCVLGRFAPTSNGSQPVSYLHAIYEGGVNRLSIGVQSFSDEQLTKLGRHHTVHDIYRAFETARLAGFNNIGIDLIYALPDQSVSEWEKTLQLAISLGPESLSLYGLSIEEGTLFHKNGVTLPSDEEQVIQYQLAQTILEDAGYRQYEISNFARPGYACRHNLLYWDRGETLGIGLSAHSYINHTHQENTDALVSYLEQIEAGHLPVKEVNAVSCEEEQVDRIIFGLRKREGIDQTILHYPVSRTETAGQLIDAGLLAIEGARVCLTPHGMLLADTVASAFL